MEAVVKRFLTLLLLVWSALPLAAARPEFKVTFDPGATYLRFGKGTTHGLKNDYLGPKATQGRLVDAVGGQVGQFVVAHADDFETIARVTTLAPGRTLGEAETAQDLARLMGDTMASEFLIPRLLVVDG